ncbi:MAG: alpha/beta hydrolase [Oscillospiraceae bacterium]|nr:alpha/beta hydrolase [Oscillospiraceae bacterium]
MKHADFNMKEHGFVGHLSEPDGGSDRAVIIVMGGEQSMLPGTVFADRFADYGITGLAVSLFGAEGLPDSPDNIPVDMFAYAAEYLRKEKHISRISIYGQSMGSIFATLAAQCVGGFENLILVSPTHVPFEGTLSDRRTTTGRSVATWQGKDIPFVKPDFLSENIKRYSRHRAASCSVTGMWKAFYKAYQDREAVRKAWLHPERSFARILLIAGEMDEMWPSSLSVMAINAYLVKKNYPKDFKVVIYPKGSHLCGLVPNREREKKLYAGLPFIGFVYRSFGLYLRDNMKYLEQCEHEIIEWLA